MNPLRRPDRPTLRTLELGGILRTRREHVRKTVTEVAGVLGWPQDKVSRWECGNRAPASTDVATFFGYCSPIVRSEYDYALTLAKEKEHPSGHWLRAGTTGDGLPHSLRSLIAAESTAHTIEVFSPDVAPGLLQTEQYMRALHQIAPGGTPEQVERFIRRRLHRQELLHQTFPPLCTFFVHERALRTVIGGLQVMQEQILQLVLASNEHCAIRVVREAAGPYGALCGPFILFGHEKHDPAVYTDTWTSAVFVEHPDDVATYRGFLTKLDSIALTTAESRSWLAGLASHYDRVEAETSCATPSPPG